MAHHHRIMKSVRYKLTRCNFRLQEWRMQPASLRCKFLTSVKFEETARLAAERPNGNYVVSFWRFDSGLRQYSKYSMGFLRTSFYPLAHQSRTICTVHHKAVDHFTAALRTTRSRFVHRKILLMEGDELLRKSPRFFGKIRPRQIFLESSSSS